ncbi:MAG: M48 family metallopeptidase [Acidobacteria bacterium]|nr:M48 family metallopeptidase [Acidobacteriota bacterium]
MHRFARLLLTALLFFPAVALMAQSSVPAPVAQKSATISPPEQPAYSLSGDKLEKAIRVSRIRSAMHFASVGWGIAALLILLGLGVPARIRDWAVGTGRNIWLQALIFVPLFMLLISLIDLPLDMYMHHINLRYGLSVQGWGAWLWDITKSFLVGMVLTYFPAVFIKWRLNRGPSSWWLWTWIVSIPFVVFMIFIAPVVLDPIMNKFEPLQPSQPALVQKLEQVVARGGLEIPPSRMFLMKASLKTTQLNAYVTGIGASKRVVVWDTALQKASEDQILFIFGHEMGHYVLHHIPKTVAFICALLLVMYFAGDRVLRWAIRHYGARWRFTAPNDWVALVVLMLAFSVFGFLMEPAINAYSRHNEHEADVYGMEAIHGIVRNPQQAAQSSFQLLGETSLVDPHPNAFVVFWSSSHPSIAARAEFAAHYDPWQPGKQPQFFKK